VQVNIDAGKLPAPGGNRVRYLKIPINLFRPEPAEEGAPAGAITLEPV
jgi:hypothetical protein